MNTSPHDSNEANRDEDRTTPDIAPPSEASKGEAIDHEQYEELSLELRTRLEAARDRICMLLWLPLWSKDTRLQVKQGREGWLMLLNLLQPDAHAVPSPPQHVRAAHLILSPDFLLDPKGYQHLHAIDEDELNARLIRYSAVWQHVRECAERLGENDMMILLCDRRPESLAKLFVEDISTWKTFNDLHKLLGNRFLMMPGGEGALMSKEDDPHIVGDFACDEALKRGFVLDAATEYSATGLRDSAEQMVHVLREVLPCEREIPLAHLPSVQPDEE